jgi:hypothetical protein
MTDPKEKAMAYAAIIIVCFVIGLIIIMKLTVGAVP